jgi:cobalt/nickel transport protein
VKTFTRTNLLLLAAVAALVVAPIALNTGKGKAEPFSGSDSQAEQSIVDNHPDYQPWFHSLYTPPSSEVESGLFALQASLGAGFLGYYFGAARTRRRLTDPTGSPTAAGQTSAGQTSAGEGTSGEAG